MNTIVQIRDTSAHQPHSAPFDYLREVVVYDYVHWKIPDLALTEHDISCIRLQAAAKEEARRSIRTDVNPKLHKGVSLIVFVDDGRIYITDLIDKRDCNVGDQPLAMVHQ
jgi:hypothetical protein